MTETQIFYLDNEERVMLDIYCILDQLSIDKKKLLDLLDLGLDSEKYIATN
jgi:hypothetical protein